MPMDFPNLDSLKKAAEVHKFREIRTDETENEYRNALANWVASIDFIESEEIRNSVGCNKWNKKQKKEILRRSGLSEA